MLATGSNLLGGQKSPVFPGEFDPFPRRLAGAFNMGMKSKSKNGSMSDNDNSESESDSSRLDGFDSSSQDVSEILSSDSDQEPNDDDAKEDNAKKRKHLVKSNRQNSRLLQLYIKKDNWSNKFMERVAAKLKLSAVQVYKWRWDRHEAEKRLRDKFKQTRILPEQVFYITKINRNRSNLQKSRRQTIQK